MLTQEQLNSEIDLAKRIYLYYFDKYATYLSIGSDKYMQWYKDLCMLYFTVRGLKHIRIDGGLIYLGDTEIDEDFYAKFGSNVREYITSGISDIVYAELDTYGNIKDISSPSTPPVIVTYQGFNREPSSVSIPIVMDNTTAITVPFNILTVDVDSVIVTVNDNNPIPVALPEEEGVHFIGTTLYWHTFYELKAGDIVYIQYLLNVS